MSVRLFPDIIVASEVNNLVKFYDDLTITSFEIPFSRLIDLQEDYKHWGISNVFIGYDDIDWCISDYKSYFERLPKIFTEYSNGYVVNLDFIQGVNKKDIAKVICNKLLIQSAYSPKILKAFGLSD